MSIGSSENLTSESLQELWGSYKKDESFALRNRLFSHYMPWMRKCVSAIFSRYRNTSIEWRDCLQTGAIALLESISRYNPEMGIPFEGFAYTRVKGSILNIMFKESIATKNITNESNLLAGDAIDDENVNDFDSFLESVISAAFSTLLDVSALNISGFSVNPLDIYTAYSQEKKLLMALDGLDEISKFIIEAHYLNFLKFCSIAESLNVSTSRVSQMHREALKKLRKTYEKI